MDLKPFYKVLFYILLLCIGVVVIELSLFFINRPSTILNIIGVLLLLTFSLLSVLVWTNAEAINHLIKKYLK
jgi:hypothetical protein